MEIQEKLTTAKKINKKIQCNCVRDKQKDAFDSCWRAKNNKWANIKASKKHIRYYN